MSLIHMTVKALRATAKANGLTGYSRMVKADLVELIASNISLASKNHAQEEAIEMDERREVVRASLGIPAGVVLNWTQIDQAYDAYCTGREEKKIDRYSHWAMSFPLAKGGDGNVCQGHADYCAEYGHATEKSTDRNGVTTVAGHCPRCGDTLKTPEQSISERDTIDQRQMIDVMTQVVDNGRDDLIPVLNKIDAAQCQVPDGRDSTIPRVHFCPRCADSTNPCDQCVLAWLVALFNITGDVTLAKLPSVSEFDCV